MTDYISKKDKKDWESFISSDEKLPNKDFKSLKQKIFKVRSIDLHGYTLEEANQTIERFIHQSYKEKVNKFELLSGVIEDVQKELKDNKVEVYKKEELEETVI